MHRHTRHAMVLILAFSLATALPAFAQHYYPGPREEWQSKTPAEADMDAGLLQVAVDYAIENESKYPTEISAALPAAIANEPHNEIVGPVKDRGGPSGVILRHGYIVAEWGDTRRVDMTFSVTKSYVSTTAGLALDKGLIADVHDPVKNYVQDGGFDSEHNAKITWHMLLNQTSEWEGTLWGKADWSDRYKGTKREVHEPGTHWLYNDVRVNRLALALLEVWRRPLPQVLKEYVMDPIDASPTWRWHGYSNSWVDIDGTRMQSVSGGGHWGGGMFISTRDHARFAYLFLRRGKWRDQQLLSERWIDMVQVPTPLRPTYGYMNWAPNVEGKVYAAAPENNFFAHGAGTNMLWVDPEHDLVSVVRWIHDPAIDGYVERVIAAIK
jgi:CubicO group peptidase (beta-lactamase class C family)